MKQGEQIRLIESNRELIDEFCKENEYIYRFLPLERLLEMLHKNEITFVSPNKWNDPFDNFLFRQNEKNIKSFLDRYFVLCFTHNSHSQAFWKTYSPNGLGVRLKLRPKVLLELLMNSKHKVWLGKMNYVYETKFVEEIQSKIGLKSNLKDNEPNDIFLNAFHLKRRPFKYEDESRISILSKDAKNDGLIKLKFSPDNLISEIYLDPRMGMHETKAWKTYLSKYNIPVKKSLLFKEKKINIQ